MVGKFPPRMSPSKLAVTAILDLNQTRGTCYKDVLDYARTKYGLKEEDIRTRLQNALRRSTKHKILTFDRGVYRLNKELVPMIVARKKRRRRRKKKDNNNLTVKKSKTRPEIKNEAGESRTSENKKSGTDNVVYYVCHSCKNKAVDVDCESKMTGTRSLVKKNSAASGSGMNKLTREACWILREYVIIRVLYLNEPVLFHYVPNS